MRTLATALTTLSLLGVAAGQEAKAPDPQARQASYAEVEALIVKIRGTRPADRSRLLDELYERCGAFLDEHLQAATAEQLSLAGTTWLQLASRGGHTEAIRARLKALRALPALPPDLARRVRLHAARLEVKVGAKAPAFTVEDPGAEGATVSLAEFAGKLLLVDFWARGNPNSQAFMERKLAPLYERFKGHASFQLLSVGMSTGGESAAAQLAWAKERGFSWRLAFDARGDCALDFGAGDVPFLVLVDPAGKVLALGPGWRVVDQVAQLLGQRLEPKPAPEAEGDGD